MECKNHGPWHLGIASEPCTAAGGIWTRSPCHALKKCIDERPAGSCKLSRGSCRTPEECPGEGDECDFVAGSFENDAADMIIKDASNKEDCEKAR